MYMTVIFLVCVRSNQNQIFHYTRCITPKRVTSWRGPSLRHCAWATQLPSNKCRSNLTGSRFELWTSHSRHESVTPKRNSITHIDRLIKGAIKKDLGLECWLKMYNSKTIIKDSFLNLLRALSCVVLSADCSVIVFLHVNSKVAFCLVSNFKHRVHKIVTRFFRVHHKFTKKVEQHWSR